jgi:hypothetical protein
MEGVQSTFDLEVSSCNDEKEEEAGCEAEHFATKITR